MNKIEFTDREFQIIQDQEFLLTKSKALSKIDDLLSKVRSELKLAIKDYSIMHPAFSKFKTSKISRGENYRGLPYLVLDYPAVFSAEDSFAFRTMFWWGNFFSCTLHLQGKPLDLYRDLVIDNIGHLVNHDIFLCINQSPWEYHYEVDNYKLLSVDDLDFIKESQFLKLSKKFKLSSWKSLPSEANRFLIQLLDIFNRLS